MEILWLLATAHVAVAAYLLYKLLVFVTADGDLSLLSKRLRSNYFKDKVIWITGASSGSEYSLYYRIHHGVR